MISHFKTLKTLKKKPDNNVTHQMFNFPLYVVLKVLLILPTYHQRIQNFSSSYGKAFTTQNTPNNIYIAAPMWYLQKFSFPCSCTYSLFSHFEGIVKHFSSFLIFVKFTHTHRIPNFLYFYYFMVVGILLFLLKITKAIV